MSLAGDALLGANVRVLSLSFAHSPINPTARSQPTFHSLPEGSAFSFSSLTHNEGH